MPRKRTEKAAEAPAPAPVARVRLELDLPHERLEPSPIPILRQIEALLREQEVEEEGSILQRVAGLLHELGELGYDRVDHWEIDPGGWLPLPEPSHRGRTEPLPHLLRALQSRAWAALSGATAFSLRLADDHDHRADAVVLRRHRERQHSIRIDFWDPPPATRLHALVERLRQRFSPLRVHLQRLGELSR